MRENKFMNAVIVVLIAIGMLMLCAICLNGSEKLFQSSATVRIATVNL